MDADLALVIEGIVHDEQVLLVLGRLSAVIVTLEMGM